jgi:Predicted membrane protein
MRLVRRMNVHHRLLIGGVLAVLVYVASTGLSSGARAIAAWDAGAAMYLGLAWLTVAGTDANATRISTQTLRQSGQVVMLVVVTAACISVASLVFLFQTVHGQAHAQAVLHSGLGFLALALSWLLIHTRFAFHYANCYYVAHRQATSQAERGLDFPGEREPDYLDFAYFSFVIGMTSQVSDVAVTTRAMRRPDAAAQRAVVCV